MDLRITGLEQVQRALASAPDRIVITGFAKALDRSAGVIAAEVEARAALLPDDSGSDTPLSEHVKTQVEVDTQRRGGIAVVGFDSTQDARTGIPQNLKALLVEAGHVIVTHKPDKKVVGHVPPHPFMRPGLDAVADKAIEVFGETLIDSLSEGVPD